MQVYLEWYYYKEKVNPEKEQRRTIEEQTAASFTVDKEKCIGCAVCVAACPMKIFEIIDNLCIMTTDFLIHR